MKPRTLTRPPIKEAVLEVLFDPGKPIGLKLLNEYGKIVAINFPNQDKIITLSGNVNDEENSLSRSLIGYAYSTNDRKTFVQIRSNGFSFIQANESYSSWDMFKPKAIEQLISFIKFIQPDAVSRYSLRFINEIKIPQNEQIDEYINVLPNANSINLPIRNFLVRVEVENSDIGAIAVISQLLSPPFVPTINIFFDIDVIINLDKPSKIDTESLLLGFENLRDFKNHIFFSILTEKGINLYI